MKSTGDAKAKARAHFSTKICPLLLLSGGNSRSSSNNNNNSNGSSKNSSSSKCKVGIEPQVNEGKEKRITRTREEKSFKFSEGRESAKLISPHWPLNLLELQYPSELM